MFQRGGPRTLRLEPSGSRSTSTGRVSHPQTVHSCRAGGGKHHPHPLPSRLQLVKLCLHQAQLVLVGLHHQLSLDVGPTRPDFLHLLCFI